MILYLFYLKFSHLIIIQKKLLFKRRKFSSNNLNFPIFKTAARSILMKVINIVAVGIRKSFYKSNIIMNY